MTKPGDLPATKKTIQELAKEFPDKTYRELEKYRDADRVEEAVGIGHNHPPKGVCVTGALRKDREYEKEHKLRQETEGELSILKGIETNRVKEAQARSSQLQEELDRMGKENNDLFIRIAELIEANEKEVKNLKWIKDHDYIFLVDENKKLHAENKKLKDYLEKRIDASRKSGM